MNPKSILKSINRHVKKNRLFEGGRSFGVDFATWQVNYPQMCREFCKAAQQLLGREGNFLPASLR
jgi:hypothetical protein